MHLWIRLSGEVPKLIEPNCALIGLDIGKSSVGQIPYAVRITLEEITCDLKIRIRIELWEGIPEPHYISVLCIG